MNQPKVKYSLSNWDLVTVNPNYKTWDWKTLFCFWAANVQSVIGLVLIIIFPKIALWLPGVMYPSP